MLNRCKEDNGGDGLWIYCNIPGRDDCGLDSGTAAVKVVRSGQILEFEIETMEFANRLGVSVLPAGFSLDKWIWWDWKSDNGMLGVKRGS